MERARHPGRNNWSARYPLAGTRNHGPRTRNAEPGTGNLLPWVLATVLVVSAAASWGLGKSPGTLEEGPVCLVLSGLAGVPEYEENFESWSTDLEEICRESLGAKTYRLDGTELRKPEIVKAFEEAHRRQGTSEAWVFLVGHGTYDGRDYRFNIKGPDLTGAELGELLDGFGDRPVYAVLATGSSGALLEPLSGPRRVIVSATKSATERQPPLFLSFFIEGARSAEADLNKDRRVSLKEIFEFSELGVQRWYEEKGRLQTEHPILREPEGTRVAASMAYLSAPPEQAYRTLEARELAPQRTRLEREIEDLKLRKTEMSSADYYAELERLLVGLAELNQKIRDLEGEP
jgi:hypothetical protein